MGNKDFSKNSTASRTYVDLTMDSGFKAVYADKSNKRCLIDLINCILPDDVHVKDIISYLDKEHDPDITDGKKTFLDLVCKGEDGSIFSVEVQNGEEEYFFQRCVYYASEHYYRELKNGRPYSELRPVYMIAIVNYNYRHTDESLWGTDNFIAHYRMIEQRTGEFAPSTIFVNFAEIARFNKPLEDCKSEKDLLFYWFLNSWRFEKDSLPKIIGDCAVLQDLARACEIAAFDTKKRTLYDRSVMHERDIIAREDFREKKGREEGLAQGELKGKKDVAKNMLAKGLDKALIAELTGLSLDEIGQADEVID